MFVDSVSIKVKAGSGGNGIVAFRREKYVPDGGPAGGSGGRGGNVVLEVDSGLRTLIDFSFQRNIKGPNGSNGESKSRTGRDAEDLILSVPPGTTIIDETSGDAIIDLLYHGDQCIIAQGGRGGRGNVAFATGKNPAPYIAENGEPGEERDILLQLKLMADVGFVGFPSVGKSTLLSSMTAAKPKIAAYHFTTLSPQLGVATTGDHRSFVLADLPGLIEGAHLGHGLGIQFLQHIERTRVIVHVVDMASTEGRDPYDDYLKIREELQQFNPSLLERRSVIVANKMDLPESFENLEAFTEKINDPSIDIVEVSGITQYGVNVLTLRLANILDELDAEIVALEPKAKEKVVYTIEDSKIKNMRKSEKVDFEVEVLDEYTYEIVSPELVKIYKMTNMNYHEAVMRLMKTMRKSGIDEALKLAGAEEGDTIWLDDYAFEFIEENFEN